MPYMDPVWICFVCCFIFSGKKTVTTGLPQKKGENHQKPTGPSPPETDFAPKAS